MRICVPSNTFISSSLVRFPDIPSCCKSICIITPIPLPQPKKLYILQQSSTTFDGTVEVHFHGLQACCFFSHSQCFFLDLISIIEKCHGKSCIPIILSIVGSKVACELLMNVGLVELRLSGSFSIGKEQMLTCEVCPYLWRENQSQCNEAFKPSVVTK